MKLNSVEINDKPSSLEQCGSFYKIFKNSKKNIENQENDQLEKDAFEDQYLQSLKLTINIGFNKILIEFLTINLFVFINGYFHSAFLEELYILINESNDLTYSTSAAAILNNKNLLNQIHLKLVKAFNQLSFLNELNEKCLNKYAKEVSLLFKDFYFLFKPKFIRTFSKPKKLKFKLKITNSTNRNELDDENNVLIETSGVEWHRTALFTRNILCKIYCPVLLYNSDFKAEAKTFLTTIATNGTILNRFLKKLTGIAACWLLVYLLYLYYRFKMRSDATDALRSLSGIFLLLLICLTCGNQACRAVVLLCIPFMATNRGRSILIFNCFVICTDYILPNIGKNIDSLQSSFACNRQVFYKHFKLLLSDTSFVRSLRETFKRFRTAGDLVKKSLKYTGRSLKQTAHTVHNLQKDFAKKVDKTCLHFKNLTSTCVKKVDSLFNCDKRITSNYLNVNAYCNILRESTHSRFCVQFSSFNDPCKHIRRQTSNFKKAAIEKVVEPLLNEFRFKHTFEHKNKNELNADQTYLDVFDNIKNVYYDRLAVLKASFMGSLDLVFPMSFVAIIIGAIVYLYRYLKQDYYQNYVIGKLSILFRFGTNPN